MMAWTDLFSQVSGCCPCLSTCLLMRQLYALSVFFIFLIVTAYDAKKIQAFYSYYGNVPEMATKIFYFCSITAVS